MEQDASLSRVHWLCNDVQVHQKFRARKSHCREGCRRAFGRCLLNRSSAALGVLDVRHRDLQHQYMRTQDGLAVQMSQGPHSVSRLAHVSVPSNKCIQHSLWIALEALRQVLDQGRLVVPQGHCCLEHERCRAASRWVGRSLLCQRKDFNLLWDFSFLLCLQTRAKVDLSG